MPTATPDRRLAPRPLPAHLISALGLWLSSRAALPFWKIVSPPWNATARRLRTLADEIDAFGFEAVATALDGELSRRATAYIDGLEAYRRHPYRRSAAAPRVLWQEGSTRLLDYGGDRTSPGVIIVPSLINRYYVLDLLPERSFLRHLANAGLRVLVVDWGEPGPSEQGLDLSGCIARLDHAFTVAARERGLGVIGYCMGGLLALALGLRRQQQLACLALLATPWDFHAERILQARRLDVLADYLTALDVDVVPVEIIQSLFFMLDPFLAERKFVRFAALDPASEAARNFVALEDWINDGVPLSIEVAQECLRSWYGDNTPSRGLWQVAGIKVEPQHFRRPALVVIPNRDRIVPPASAAPLAAAIPDATPLRPALGHIGMMSATHAPELLWEPVVQWLGVQLAAKN
jgi:polyhydroxyalkanoate synthase subunit PhaC